MAELSYTFPTTSAAGGGTSSNLNVLSRTLFRTGGPLLANTPFNLNSPGSGWTSSGDTLTISGGTQLVDQVQVYRGGQLQLAGESGADNNDFYYTGSDNTVAFEYLLQKNDVLQIWQFVTTSG